jgi:hypothetical protein
VVLSWSPSKLEFDSLLETYLLPADLDKKSAGNMFVAEFPADFDSQLKPS